MTDIRIAEIRRHPVKGLGHEALSKAALAVGAALPGDRLWAIAHGRAEPETAPGWAPPRGFVRPTTNPALAQAACRLCADGRTVAASHPSLGACEADLETEAGRAALAAWAEPVASAAEPAPFTVRSAGAAAPFADLATPGLSIALRQSLEALSAAAGADLEASRFRANLWLEGGAPWDEFDWIGRTLRVGGAELRVVERIPRCMSPAANPATGARDVDVTRVLHGAYGHMDFAVFAEVVVAGEVATGDAVSLV